MTKGLALARTLRQAHPDVGIVLFGYANPIIVMGPEAFAKAAREAGADGVLCVDYPADEDAELDDRADQERAGLHPAAGADVDAARSIDVAARAATGFLYYASLTGITGTHLSDMEEPRAKVAAIKARTGGKLPVVVGFGIRTPGAARAVELRGRRGRRQRRRRDRGEGGGGEARSGFGPVGVGAVAARRARRRSGAGAAKPRRGGCGPRGSGSPGRCPVPSRAPSARGLRRAAASARGPSPTSMRG